MRNMMRRFAFALVLLTPGLLAAGVPKGLDWVALERGPCFGNCPIYEVTLRSDGLATYVGGDYAPRRGRFEAQVDSAAVARLLARLDSVGFWEMKVDRQLRVTDLPDVILRAERDGRQHRVHANLPPAELRPIHAAIDSIAEALDWRPVQERTRAVAANAPADPARRTPGE